MSDIPCFMMALPQNQISSHAIYDVHACMHVLTMACVYMFVPLCACRFKTGNWRGESILVDPV